MNKRKNFTNAKVERIIRTAGAERVSAKATIYLNELLSDIAFELSSFAGDICKLTERKTIRDVDVELALEKYKPKLK